jgi:hypothetical protein
MVVGSGSAFLSLDRLGELDELEFERLGNPTDGDPRGACLSPLDPYIRACRQSGAMSDFFLGLVALATQPPDDGGESLIGYRREGRHRVGDIGTPPMAESMRQTINGPPCMLLMRVGWPRTPRMPTGGFFVERRERLQEGPAVRCLFWPCAS